MSKILYSLALLSAVLFFTSCTAFLSGVAEGMASYANGMYGGYGLTSTPMATPAQSFPSMNTLPSVPMETPSWDAVFSTPVSTGSYDYSSPSGTTIQSGSSGSNFCRTCSNTRKCYVCHGTGKRTDNLFGTGVDYSKDCGICRGTGKCPSCGK